MSPSTGLSFRIHSKPGPGMRGIFGTSESEEPMTQQKHLKQIVRARMEKTGERYAAARRHVVASEAQETPSYPFHFPGTIPAATGLRSILTAAGLRDPLTNQQYSETTAFGLAGGVGIGVFSFLYERDDFASFFIAGRHLWQDDASYISRAAARLGAEIRVFESASQRKAARDLDEALETGAPCIAWVDAGLLPHRASNSHMEGGGYHVVTVHGRTDSGRGVIVGDLADNPITIDAEAFAASRKRITKFKNRLVQVTGKQKSRDPNAAAIDGLRACHSGLMGADAIGKSARRFKLDAIRDWSGDLRGRGARSWGHVFPRGHRLWTGLTMLYEFIELYGTGGGLCRPIFADYLSSLGEQIGRSDLADIGAGYNELGEAWTGLAAAALPEGSGPMAEARHLLTRRAELRASAPDDPAMIHELSLRLNALAEQAARDFPLSEDDCGSLLSELADQASMIHDKEKDLSGALGRAVAMTP